MTDPLPRPVWRFSTVSALYACLTVAYCWPLFLSFTSGLPNDTGDPGLLTYLIWWNAHSVPLTERWWNTPMFYPQTGALAFSDTLLGLSPFSTPLVWAGVPPVAVFNTLFVASVWTAAISSHALARHLTGRHDVAILAGLAFGFSPYRATQMPHLQLLVTCWMPLGLLALHRYLRHRRRGDLVLLGICWLMNGLTNGYYLVFFAVLVGLWMLWFVRERRDWVALMATLGLASLPFVPVIIGHAEIQASLGMMRGRDEIESFSADLTAFLSASSHAWLPFLWSLKPNAEGELYPGAAIVVLTIVAGVVGWRRIAPRTPIRGRKTLVILGVTALVLAWLSWVTDGLRLEVDGTVLLSLTRPHRIVTVGLWFLIVAGLLDRRLADAWRRRSPFAFYTLAAVVLAVLALGPVGRVFGVRFMHFAPYAWLMELPGGDSLRVPARFAMLMILCLSQTAAMAFVRLTPNGVRPRMLALVAVLIAADGWVPQLQVAPTPEMVDLPGLESQAAVLEVPMRDLWSDTAALLRATKHGHPVINGFSGYGPPHYNALMEGLASGDASIISSLRQFGPLAVLVNRHDDAEGVHEAFVSKADEAKLLYRTTVGPVYRFPAAPAPAPRAGDGPLPIASIETSVNSAGAAAMTDGRLDTQWKTGEPQAPGHQVTIHFTGDVEVSRLEMDLGDARVDYPRELRIEARAGDGSVATLWHSGTAGPAMLGAMRDRLRVPVVIDLPAGSRARDLILTLTGSHDELYWTVAELRVNGRQVASQVAEPPVVIGSSAR